MMCVIARSNACQFALQLVMCPRMRGEVVGWYVDRRRIKASTPSFAFLTLHSSPPLTMTTIDHTAHPFIMDEIIKYASMEALFKLRITSRTFRTRIDTMVGKHAVLGPDYVGGTRLYLPPRYRFSPGRSTWELTTIPSAVHVLDVDDELLRSPIIDDTLRPFTGVTTLRRFGHQHEAEDATPALPGSTATVVNFLLLVEPKNAVCPLYITLDPQARHVIHVRVDDPLGGLFGVYRRESDNVVVVLWPSFLGDYAETGSTEKGKLYAALFAILHSGPRRLTVVGLQRLFTSSLAPPSPDSVCGHVIAAIESFRERLATPMHLRFLSHEEWWDELPDGEKDVVGVWPAEWEANVSGVTSRWCADTLQVAGHPRTSEVTAGHEAEV